MLNELDQSHQHARQDSAAPISSESILPSSTVLGLAYGFELIRTQYVDAIKSEVRIYRHARTGADVMFISNSNQDRNFNISFRTIADNEKGIPHAAEHIVFRGSKNYPGTDPLNDYLQQSLKLESNAETGHDYTSFYGGSPNPTDLLYQFQITLDGVLNPLLTKRAFAEEYWRLDIIQKNESDATTQMLNGIVLNEMKDYYSQPSEVHNTALTKLLFPDTYYQYDSAGNPNEICTAQLEDIKAHVEKYYHPSNMRVIFEGDIEKETYLQLLDQAFEGFEARDRIEQQPIQPRFDKPKKAEVFYPAGEKEDASRDSIVSVSWSLGRGTDVPSDITLRVLEYLLIGDNDSPIKQSLRDAEFGEDIIEECLGKETIETTLTFGVFGTGISKADQIEQAILNKLAEIKQTGFNSEQVKRAINSIKFEIACNNSSANVGQSIIADAMLAWYRDEDPIGVHNWQKELQELENKLALHPQYFDELVEKLLLNNNHRLTLIVRPKRGLLEEWDSLEQEQINKLSTSSAEEHKDIIDDITNKLPRLKINDLTRHSPKVVAENREGIWCYPIDNAEIVRFSVGLNFRALPKELLPYIKAYSSIISNLTQRRLDYNIGEIADPEIHISEVQNYGVNAYILFTGDVPKTDAPHYIKQLVDSITTVDLNQRKEILRILIEGKAEFEDEIQSDPFTLASLRACAKLDTAELIEELTTGATSLGHQLQIISEVRSRWASTLERFQLIQDTILKTGQPQAFIAGNNESLDSCYNILKDSISKFGNLPEVLPEWAYSLNKDLEGFVIPSPVTAVAKAFNLSSADYRYHGSLLVLLELLERAYLWPVIRRELGAYSPKLSYHRASNTLIFGSSSDARPLDTIHAIDGAGDWLRSIAPKIKELRRSKIGAIGTLDQPTSAFDRAEYHFADRLRSRAITYREVERAGIFEASALHCLELADILDRVRDTNSATVIFGSRKVLMDLNAASRVNKFTIHGLT